MASDDATRARLLSEYFTILDCEPEDYNVFQLAKLLKQIFPRTRTRTCIHDILSESPEYVQYSLLGLAVLTTSPKVSPFSPSRAHSKHTRGYLR
jgi:hypothetical protein